VKQQLHNRGNQKFLSEKVKVDDYVTSQKCDLFFSKGVGKRLIIYVAVKTHSPKILMVNGTEIGRLVLFLKCVYVCVLLLHFVEECRHKCVDIQYLF